MFSLMWVIMYIGGVVVGQQADNTPPPRQGDHTPSAG